MPQDRTAPDVVVIGGGVAGLCAAIAARQAGARVTLVEGAARAMRGGNARHARNLRAAHEAPTRFSPARYDVEEFVSELAAVAGDGVNSTLRRRLAEDSVSVVPWLIAQGVPFQPVSTGLLPTSRRTSFLLGGGKTMMNILYQTAETLGVNIQYNSRCGALTMSDPHVSIETPTGFNHLRPGAVVLCCGSAQPSEASNTFINRGASLENAALLHSLTAQDVAWIGAPNAYHLVAVDDRSPPYDGGIATRVLGIPQGIVVDHNGVRFHDEGADTGPTRYSVWGRKIAEQPVQRAWLILDASGLQHVPKPLYPPLSATSLLELAVLAGLSPRALVDTISTFNASVHQDGHSCRTVDLHPPKSRCARPLTESPFAAIPIRPGITFAHQGVRVSADMQITTNRETPCANLFAAGSIMSVNLLGSGYLAGAGLTIGVVFGRRAGEAAARHARAVTAR